MINSDKTLSAWIHTSWLDYLVLTLSVDLECVINKGKMVNGLLFEHHCGNPPASVKVWIRSEKCAHTSGAIVMFTPNMLNFFDKTKQNKGKTGGPLLLESQRLKNLWLVPALRAGTGLRPSLMSAKSSETFFFDFDLFPTFLFSAILFPAAVVTSKTSRHFNSLHPLSVSCVVKYARLSVGYLPGAMFAIRLRACRTFTLPKNVRSRNGPSGATDSLSHFLEVDVNENVTAHECLKLQIVMIFFFLLVLSLEEITMCCLTVMWLPVCFGESNDLAQVPKYNLLPQLPSGSSFISLFTIQLSVVFRKLLILKVCFHTLLLKPVCLPSGSLVCMQANSCDLWSCQVAF